MDTLTNLNFSLQSNIFTFLRLVISILSTLVNRWTKKVETKKDQKETKMLFLFTLEAHIKGNKNRRKNKNKERERNKEKEVNKVNVKMVSERINSKPLCKT